MGTMHKHAWYFTFPAWGWQATCGCGLEVKVEARPGGETWRWRIYGLVPTPETMLAGYLSVQQARRELLAR